MLRMFAKGILIFIILYRSMISNDNKIKKSYFKKYIQKKHFKQLLETMILMYDFYTFYTCVMILKKSIMLFLCKHIYLYYRIFIIYLLSSEIKHFFF